MEQQVIQQTSAETDTCEGEVEVTPSITEEQQQPVDEVEERSDSS